MPSTLVAKLAVAVFGLVEGADVFFTPDHLDGFRGPESECVDRGG